MKWVVIALVVLAVVVIAAALIRMNKQRQEGHARTRADELRHEAAGHAAVQPEQDARARQAEAEAERVRAEADQLEAQAHEERTAYDMERAQQEDAVREADRLDPDVDDRSDDHRPRPGS